MIRTIITFTAGNPPDLALLPTDLGKEIVKLLSDGTETRIEYRREVETVRECEDGLDLHYAYFPASGRGAVCTNAGSDWTDADSMDDLVDRWENFEERWSN